MNERLKKISVYIVLCAVIAVLSCPAAEAFSGMIRGGITFIGDLAVLSMFSLYFPLAASLLSETRRGSRAAIFCAADCVSLVIKTAFCALCAISGGMMTHAAALMIDCIFSRIYLLSSFKENVTV